jgi:hypothetical protein
VLVVVLVLVLDQGGGRGGCQAVILAKAGIQNPGRHLDSGFRRNDGTATDLVKYLSGNSSVIIFPANSIQAATMPPIQKVSWIGL